MKIKGLFVGLVIGVFVAALSIFTVAYTAAIAMPNSIADIIRGSQNGMLLLGLWDFFVVQLLGVGVLSLIITFLAIKLLPGNNLWKGIGISSGAIGLMYATSLASFSSTYVGHHLYEIAILVCVLPLSYFVSKEKIV